MAPVGIGMALFIAELVGVYYTGGVSSILLDLFSLSRQANICIVIKSSAVVWALRNYRVI